MSTRRHFMTQSAAAASALIESLRAAVPGVAFAVEAGIQYGCERGYVIPGEHPNDRNDPRMRRDDAVALCREGVTKLIVQHAGWLLEDLLEVTRAHAGALASVTHSGSNFVEVAAAGVTKALALEAYCAERGIAAAQVIAFGDMPNDLPMLEWAGTSYAMANADPAVLAAATGVAPANDDDGVATVLGELFGISTR